MTVCFDTVNSDNTFSIVQLFIARVDSNSARSVVVSRILARNYFAVFHGTYSPCILLA